jgi:uncharacterized membrane protein
MNPAHLHLLLNHFPTIGFGIGLGLFLVSLVVKSNDLRQASLIVFVGIALLSIPTYLSGNAAHFVIKDQPEVSESLIATHQDAALLALGFMEITGLLAWFELWRSRHIKHPIRWNLAAVLVLSVVTFGLMAKAANIGGEIRHPEIRAVEESTAWPKAAVMAAAFVIDNPWVWPIAEIFHFIGLCLLFGVVLLVNLRLLGIIRHVSFDAVYQLLPWGILGFAINFASGMLFFIAVPDQYTQNTGFYWKMGLLLLAAVTILYPTVFEEVSALKAEEDAPLQSKIIAASSILLWVAVIFLGRYLPYIGME